MTSILSRMNLPGDVKTLNDEELKVLAKELRSTLIKTVSENGGHLASNLGVVELTLALYRAFNPEKDTFVFDVGHQSYVHKLLSGRRDDFSTLRKKNGIAGFPKIGESEYDAFNTGHATTSLSAALGMLRAKRLMGDNSYVVAIIGDGAFTGGMAFEAINDAGQSKLPLIIILNDNNMAIADNVGALNQHLNKMRISRPYRSFKRALIRAIEKMPEKGEKLNRAMERIKRRIKYFLLPDMLFEDLGLMYLGPIDGHNTELMTETFKKAKELAFPVLIHVTTVKGKGYNLAEADPEKFHGIGPFDILTGETKNGSKTNSDVFAEALIELAENDKRIVAISAAMPQGTGLVPFMNQFPNRFFDVGIAEQHAVTMAGGMARIGLKPVVAIYSTFLQRAYDQIIHDVALMRLPVVFAIDRAGLIGEDGETHQGIFDIAYMLTVPRMLIFSPSSIFELRAMLKIAISIKAPCAIRYSRGILPRTPMKQSVEFGKWETLKTFMPVTIIATGRLVENASNAVDDLPIGLINARFIRPMDKVLMEDLKRTALTVITLEDGIASSGFGLRIAQYFSGFNIRVINIGTPDFPLSQATIKEQDDECGFTIQKIRALALSELARVNGDKNER
ncbi:MAG: 1-deoxy-D-xylulose-5-phosphate synthase [Clostridia bacterium]